MAWPEKICRSTPLLLLQGSADWRADAASALKLAGKLYALNTRLRFVLLEGATHGLRGLPLHDQFLYD